MNAEAPTQLMPRPEVPDFDLLRCVGSGAFGEVWLARARPTQRYRAIKLVCRSRFHDASLYETEFGGLKKFEELSREHAGFIDILHISRNEQTGCFSYVMELADDLLAGQSFAPANYVPKTLASELARRQAASPSGQARFTAAECVAVALNVTDALAALHDNGLVHRDLKPANIVFVRGNAKVADVGLVTELKTHAVDGTLVGSPHFMDAQVHGTVQGDLFGFGKVLYVMATGRPAGDWPALPEGPGPDADADILRELHEISLKACHLDRLQRYRSAREIHDELLFLRVGKSARRLQRLERLFAGLKRFALVALIFALLAGLLVYQAAERRKQAAELRQHKVGSYVALGTRALDENDLLGALPWFAAALREDADDPRTGPVHRLRLGALFHQCPTIVQMWFTDHPRKFAQFAGQENQVLVPTADQRWAIHDLATGRPLYPAFGPRTNGGSIALSPASHLAAVGVPEAGRAAVGIWNFVTGQPAAALPCPDAPGDVAVSADGTQVAAAVGTNALVWRLGDRNPPRILGGHSQFVTGLAFSQDGHRLVTGSGDATVCVWDLPSGQVVSRFTNHTTLVWSVAFSPDASRVASAGFDRTVRVWETATGRALLPPLAHGDGVFSAEFNPDGTRLVSAGLDFSVCVWDALTGKLLQRLPHNSKPIHASFSPSGRHIITACYDGTIRVWALPPGPEPRPSLRQFSGDGLSSAEPLAHIVQLETVLDAQPLASLPVTNLVVRRLLWNHEGSRLLALAEPEPVSRTNAIQALLWDVRNATTIGTPKRLDRIDTDPVLSPSGRLLLAHSDGHQAVWDLDRNRELLRLPEPAHLATFDLAERRLATAVANSLQVWDLASGKPLLPAPCHHDTRVESVQWSPDDRYVLTACWDESFKPEYAQVWDAASGARAGPALTHRDGVRFAAFSPDGRKVVTCGEDYNAMLWDWRTGRQLTPPLRHKHVVVYAAFTPDGRCLATACRDHTARLWDAETGEPITQPLAQPDDVNRVQWVAGGRALVTRTRDGHTRLWPLPPDLRPLEKLVGISELLSAEQIHPTESAMPESKEALQRLWNQLRADYPTEFSLQAE
jgi:WD40 repeat protein/serine/threonine protein kinase